MALDNVLCTLNIVKHWYDDVPYEGGLSSRRTLKQNMKMMNDRLGQNGSIT